MIAWTELQALAATHELPPNLASAAQTCLPGVAGWAPRQLISELQRFFSEDSGRERLAILSGRVWTLEDGRFLTQITRYCALHDAPGSSTHVTMLPHQWKAVWADLQGTKEEVVGWAHSHPGCGLFFSSADHATQAMWFAQPWSLALVFDPVTGDYRAFAGAKATPAQVLLEEDLTESSPSSHPEP